MYRALLEAGPATGAPVVVETVAVARAELDDRVLGTGAQAAVALEAVAARQAPLGLVDRRRLIETAHHLGEGGRALLDGLLRLRLLGGVGEVPHIQLVEGGRLVLRRDRVRG